MTYYSVGAETPHDEGDKMKTKLLYLAMLIPGLANAQVMLEQTQAESGSYYKGVLAVTQGCDGSGTTRITVDIPEGLQFVQPMPKAGWQLEIVKKPVERPFFRDGIEITEAVRQITWSGNSLLDIHFDEFIFHGRIGVGATSVLYFPVTQKCESGELHWDQMAESKPTKKTMPEDSGPKAVNELLEDMEELVDEQHQHGEPKAHQHQHQHGQAKDEVEHSGDHDQLKAKQHQHGQAKDEMDHSVHHDHQMEMTEQDSEMDHSVHAGHSGHGQSTLQYPAPFVTVVDGTGDHHNH